MSAQPVFDPSQIDLLVDAAVAAGATVVELRRDLGLRARLRSVCGVGAVPASTWHLVRDRVGAISVRAAGPDRARCKRCSSPVRWVVTSTRGQRMPIDPLPHPMGNVTLIEEVSGRHTAVVVGNDKLPLEGPAYRSHFATCPSIPRAPKTDTSPGAEPGQVVVMSCRMPGCTWQRTGPARHELDREWSGHWASTHQDRCERCGVGPLRWARRVDTGGVIALDPVSPKGGPWALRDINSSAAKAEPAATLLEGFAEHVCPQVQGSADGHA